MSNFRKTEGEQSLGALSRRTMLAASLSAVTGAGAYALSQGVARAFEAAKPIGPVPVNGAFDKRFTRVRDVLARNLASGDDIGASVSVLIDGKPVVDIWGGATDVARTKPWRRDTIVNTFSTTKTMTALTAMVLVDRGKLDLDAPVTKYWPEFAPHGKERVKVRHFLSHSSGLAGWTEPVSVEDICNHKKATSMLAAQAPWWEPGTQCGYHPITFGPLIGELVRRIDGRSLGRYFQEEVARPLGGDFHIGTGPELDHRVAVMIAGTPPRPRGDDRNAITDRAFFNPFIPPETSGTLLWRRAELGGSNGHGSASGIAAIQSVVACGGEVRGVRLLSKETIARILEPQTTDKPDIIAGFPVRWGLGYGLENKELAAVFQNRFKDHRVVYWGGSGGSLVISDLDLRMTVAFAMNRHVEGPYDQRGIDVVVAAYDSLKS